MGKAPPRAPHMTIIIIANCVFALLVSGRPALKTRTE